MPLKVLNAQDSIPVTTLEGDVITLSDYREGKPLYLKFWASWCQPCIAQMPHLQSIYEEYGDNIKTIAVNIDINDSIDAVNEVKRKFSLTVPIAVDSTGDLSHAFNLIGTPYHILINKEGEIVYKGNKASAELDRAIRLLAENKSVILNKKIVDSSGELQARIDISKEKDTALFFTSTWCDSYLKDSRPGMSKNCINAQYIVNSLYKKLPNIHWVGVISRLWTGGKELEEYRRKYQIAHSLVIDVNDQEYSQYNVKTFPTIILFHDGKEVFRTSDFSEESIITTAIFEMN